MKTELEKLTDGIVAILKEMRSKGEDPVFSCETFKIMLIEKGLSLEQSEHIIEKIIGSGRVGWLIFSNQFTLLEGV